MGKQNVTTELNQEEFKLIRYIRELEFGELRIKVIEGKPTKGFEVSRTEKWVRFQ